MKITFEDEINKLTQEIMSESTLKERVVDELKSFNVEYKLVHDPADHVRYWMPDEQDGKYITVGFAESLIHTLQNIFKSISRKLDELFVLDEAEYSITLVDIAQKIIRLKHILNSTKNLDTPENVIKKEKLSEFNTKLQLRLKSGENPVTFNTVNAEFPNIYWNGDTMALPKLFKVLYEENLISLDNGVDLSQIAPILTKIFTRKNGGEWVGDSIVKGLQQDRAKKFTPIAQEIIKQLKDDDE
jgi:hypothetical protein